MDRAELISDLRTKKGRKGKIGPGGEQNNHGA
jgi:hypothetical protein